MSGDEGTPLEKFLNRKRAKDGSLVPRKPKRPPGAAIFAKTRTEAIEMMRTTVWDGCRPAHLVALHDVMHERTYGVPSGMTASERQTAAKLVGGLVKRVFDGEPEKAIVYFRWVWTREISRERWCRENDKSRGRLTIGAVCSSRYVTDWRVDEHRAKARQTGGRDAR